MVNLLFLKLMSQHQEWDSQSGSEEYTEPSRQTIDIFELEWQVLQNKMFNDYIMLSFLYGFFLMN